MLTNSHTGTRIDEVAPGIYRINTPLKIDAMVHRKLVVSFDRRDQVLRDLWRGRAFSEQILRTQAFDRLGKHRSTALVDQPIGE